MCFSTLSAEKILSRHSIIRIMKTTTTMLAAFAVMIVGALAAPAVIGATTTIEVVAADEQTVTLDVSGLK